jgi:hypothetical protein
MGRHSFELKREGENLGSVISGEKFGWSSWMIGGSHMSVRDRERSGYGFGNGQMGRGLISLLGQKGSRGPFMFFFLFLFLLFSFSISFITFAFYIQMTSNQFVKFSKIQRNKLGQ